MEILKWLRAYAVVYSSMVRNTSRGKVALIAAVAIVAIVAALLGPVGTVVLIIVALFVLPAINTDVRRAVDREYQKRK